MIVYIVLETADPEIVSINVFAARALADAHLEACMEENRVPEHSVTHDETEGTRRIAGDNTYCVQLIEQTVKEG